MVQIEEPVYVISIAARLVGMHPQSLRLYERIGLIRPAREGNKRLYSVQDIERLRRIQHLTQDMGVNLAGVEIVFDLLAKMEAMRDEMMEHIAEMEAEMRREMEKGNRREGE
jgi:MerR family transcriptional regulator, heat shock protein HspR